MQPTPLTRFQAFRARRRHRRDWAWDPDATTGDSTLRLRRQLDPPVTASIVALQKVGTGQWSGSRPLDRTGRMVVANIGGPCVGYAYATDDFQDRPGHCILDDIVVAPAHRGRGVGHALIAELAAWYAADGYHTVRGYPSGSVAAEGGLTGWYSRMGFRRDDSVLRGQMCADISELVEHTAPFRSASD